jgi:putative protease
VLDIQEIKSLLANKNQTKVLILVNKFFFEPEILELEIFLVEISKLDIDGVIFSDMAIPQICYENKLRIDLIYDPDTLVCN